MGRDLFFVPGSPALIVDGLQARVNEQESDANLDGVVAPVIDNETIKVLILGEAVTGGAQLFDFSGAETLLAPPEVLLTEHAMTVLPDTGDVLTIGGARSGAATSQSVRFSPRSRSFETIDLLATARRNPSVAMTAELLLVVGGEDDSGAPIGDIEVFDRESLEPRVSLPMLVPRKDCKALSLSNGQVLIVGGRDQDGMAVTETEIFTADE
jgi:hypothetical protein